MPESRSVGHRHPGVSLSRGPPTSLHPLATQDAEQGHSSSAHALNGHGPAAPKPAAPVALGAGGYSHVRADSQPGEVGP
jgi:hypothetical protein